MPRPLPVVLALGLLALPLPLMADTLSGSVDGAAQEWHLLPVDGRPSGGWSDFGGITQVEIFGFPRADSTSDVTGALEISLTLMGNSAAGVSVVYYGGGVSGLYTIHDEDEIRVSLSEVRVEGETLHLSGKVETEVFRMASIVSEELDPDDSHAVSASFDLALPQR